MKIVTKFCKLEGNYFKFGNLAGCRATISKLHKCRSKFYEKISLN